MKVDVEGAATSVLRTLEHTSRVARPICFFEVLPNFVGEERTRIDPSLAERQRAAADGLFNLFATHGYDIRQITNLGDEHLINRFDLDNASGYVGRDYVAYPR